MAQIDRTRLTELLDELFRRARAQEVVLKDVYIVGGAAMMLQLGRERMTGDIDGVLNPSEEITAIARGMWEQYGLIPDWLNDRFLVHASGIDPAADHAAKVLTVHGYRIRVASPRYLLAMKLAASRAKDYEDITALIWHLDAWDVNALVELTIAVMGDDGIQLGIPHDLDVREELLLSAQDATRRARGAGRPRWLTGERGPTG